ncbi:Tubulin beta-2 chain [Orchesella cincta]|uniref:Tubulin beta chain n=1 Tax=Orchesella cincta TaxID=48709 RepID=A0A1D2MBL8_ORCCI|nr:Tubulin beta-2 chain [Orchesella cincta]
MREVVTIQLGHCGNALGSTFWEDISQEHSLLPTGVYCGNHSLQLEKISSFFTPGATLNYVPRSILVDLDPSSLESVRCSPIGQLFRPDNFIFGKVGAGNNFARGNFTDGVDIRDMTLEAIRKEMELCHQPSAFQMIHALGGGTGSGMGALLLEMLKEEYPKILILNETVIPSSKVSEVVVEPYNSILAAPSLIKNSDVTVLLDNECLYEICQKTLMLESPILEDLNFVMAKAMAGLSSTYRFPARGHVDWAAMRCVMVPSPKLHFFLPAYAPLNSRGVQAYRTFSVHDISHQLLNGKILLGGKEFQSGNGKYLTALALFRGYRLREEEVSWDSPILKRKIQPILPSGCLIIFCMGCVKRRRLG